MRRATAILACAIALVAGGTLRAQEPVVISQTVTIDGVPSRIPVSSSSSRRARQAFSQADVHESIAHLVGLGRFEDVVVSRDVVPGGIALTYALIPSRMVRSIAFKGDVGLPDRDLHDRIKEHFGNTPSLARLPDLLTYLKTVYRDEGYDSPKLTARPALEGAAHDELVIDVDAGSRLRIRHIQAEGNTPDGLASIPAKLRLTTGDVYRKAEVDGRLNAYITELRARGYYEARADHELRPTADGTTGDVVVNIDSGAHVTIVFEGDDVPSRMRRELVPIEREGSLDQDLLEDSANRIRGYFQAQGCRDADVTYTPTPRNGELALVFHVKKGPQFHVAKVDVTGATAIPAVELLPRLKTKAGEPFVQSTVDADVATIGEAYHRRGYTAVKVTPTVLPVPGGGSPVPLSVELAVVEGPATIVSSIEIAGAHAVPEADLRAALGSKPGLPFYAPQVALDRDAIVFALLNRGYKTAAVDARIRPSTDRTKAAIVFTVSEGTQVFVGHILIVGNVRVHRHDSPRARAHAGPAAQLLRRLGQPAEDQRARPLQARPDHELVSERRTSDLLVSRGSATTTLGYAAASGGRVLRQEERPARPRRSSRSPTRVRGVRPTESLRQEPVAEPVRPRGARRARRRRRSSRASPRRPASRSVITACSARIGTEGVQHAGDFRSGFEQGVRSSFDFTRKGLASSSRATSRRR